MSDTIDVSGFELCSSSIDKSLMLSVILPCPFAGRRLSHIIGISCFILKNTVSQQFDIPQYCSLSFLQIASAACGDFLPCISAKSAVNNNSCPLVFICGSNKNYTLNRKLMMSPSSTVYALPSSRILPAALTAFSSPNSLRSS